LKSSAAVSNPGGGTFLRSAPLASKAALAQHRLPRTMLGGQRPTRCPLNSCPLGSAPVLIRPTPASGSTVHWGCCPLDSRRLDGADGCPLNLCPPESSLLDGVDGPPPGRSACSAKRELSGSVCCGTRPRQTGAAPEKADGALGRGSRAWRDPAAERGGLRGPPREPGPGGALGRGSRAWRGQAVERGGVRGLQGSKGRGERSTGRAGPGGARRRSEAGSAGLQGSKRRGEGAAEGAGRGGSPRDHAGKRGGVRRSHAQAEAVAEERRGTWTSPERRAGCPPAWASRPVDLCLRAVDKAMVVSPSETEGHCQRCRRGDEPPFDAPSDRVGGTPRCLGRARSLVRVSGPHLAHFGTFWPKFPAFSIFPRLFSPSPTLARILMSACLGDPSKIAQKCRKS
jgi:hypothetical protein